MFKMPVETLLCNLKKKTTSLISQGLVAFRYFIWNTASGERQVGTKSWFVFKLCCIGGIWCGLCSGSVLPVVTHIAVPRGYWVSKK